MKKMFLVAFIVAAAFAACGGKKKPDTMNNTGSGSAMEGSGSGSADTGSGAAGSGSGG